MIRFPGKEHAGKHVKGFIQDHDVLPTLLDILDIKKWPYLESQINGLDAVPLVSEETSSIRDYIICGYEIFTCVRDNSWHYIISDNWEDPPERESARSARDARHRRPHASRCEPCRSAGDLPTPRGARVPPRSPGDPARPMAAARSRRVP